MGTRSLRGAPAIACSERSVAEAIERRERRLLRFARNDPEDGRLRRCARHDSDHLVFGQALRRAISQPGACQGPSAGGTAFVTVLRPPSRRRMLDPGGRAALQATLLVRHRIRRIIEKSGCQHVEPERRPVLSVTDARANQAHITCRHHPGTVLCRITLEASSLPARCR